MSRDFRLLVFDWDGTLMDSLATIVACMSQTARDLDLEPFEEERVRQTVGLGLVDTMRALGFSDDRESWGPVVERYRENWISTFRFQPRLFEGAADALRALGDAGYLLAVATGKSRRGLAHDLEKTGIGPLFHASRTADETHSKPNPQMLLELLGELGARGEQTLMIGDTTFDLEMARNGGTRSLAVTSGSHRREELERLGPLACLPGVSELPAWLGVGSTG